jgi:hypothetical protein
MLLTETDRKNMRNLVDGVIASMKYREGALSDAEAAKLPEQVKGGRLAKLLSDTFRMLHERVDEKGNVRPETTAIAKRELHDMIARADYLATHGRPPHLSKDFHERDGLKKIAEAHRAKRAPELAKAG